MNSSTSQATSDRERLRQQWLQQAEAVFECLFDPDEQEHLVTFDQREERVIALTRELSTWLLEEHAAKDPTVRLPAEHTASCPKCSRPAQRLTPQDESLPLRHLRCEDGEVTLRREQWHCKTCRVSFFPSGPSAATGDRRL